MCFDLLFNFCLKYFSFQKKKIELDIIINVHRCYYYHRILMNVEFSRYILKIYCNINFMKIRLVGAELILRTDRRTDGLSDRHDEANRRFSS